MLARGFGDACRFARGGVILPEPRVRREIPGPFRIQREWFGVRIDGQRRGPRSIDADTDHTVSREPVGFPCSRQCPSHRRTQPPDVVGRILPRQVWVLRMQENPIVAAGVIENARANNPTVGGVDDYGANRVRTVVDPYRVATHCASTGVLSASSFSSAFFWSLEFRSLEFFSRRGSGKPRRGRQDQSPPYAPHPAPVAARSRGQLSGTDSQS